MRRWKIALGSALMMLPAAGPAEARRAECAARTVDVGGYGLWADRQGTASTTIAFEAGGGDDSSVWAEIAPQIRALGYSTLVYDRAGLGKSSPRPGRYTLDRDVRDFRAVLDACGVTAPVYVVSHSYGGFVSMAAAARDRRIAGLVLVDANLPGYFTPARVDALLGQYRPQYAALRQQAPKLAAAMIPMMEAYPATVATARRVHLPKGLAIVDIVAEHSWATSDADAEAMRQAHAAFAAAAPGRTAVFASGSSHRIAKDRPDLIIAAVRSVVR